MTVGAWKAWVKQGHFSCDEASASLPEDTPLFLSQDSRELETAKPGACGFVALHGNWHDGHAFLEEAHAAGARYFIVHANATLPALPASDVVRCKDPVSAWQQLTRAWRDACGTSIIAITGSNGKTTVKEWLLQLIAPRTVAFGSPRSYNSQVGVPLALGELQPEHQWGIVEAGISQPGEMERLAACIAPNVGVLTHLGEAHLEHFDGAAHLRAEKLRLFDACDWVAMPGYLTDAEAALKRNGIEVRTWGEGPENDLVVASHVVGHGRSVTASYAGDQALWTLPFADEVGFRNAMTAALVGLVWGIPLPELAEALARFRDLEHRMQRIRKGDGNWVLSDAYTNDWDALALALGDLQRIPGTTRKTAIIGPVPGMRPDEASRLEALLERNRIDAAWVIGEQWHAFPSSRNIRRFDTADEALAALQQQGDAFNGCHVLVKGPRAERFERLTEALVQRGHATRLVVDLNALTHNLQSIRGFIRAQCPPGTDLIAVIKASGYGTHAAAIARVLQFHRVPIVAVACTEEGVDLRNHGITGRILVLNPTPDTFSALIQHRLEPTVHSVAQFDALVHALRESNAWPVHMKIDTGMHRLGLGPDEINALQHIAGHPAVEVKTVFSHLASADRPEQDDATRAQLVAFDRALATVRKFAPQAQSHVLNSSGMLRFPSASGHYVRAGIALLGVLPTPFNALTLEPVVQFETAIASLHRIPPHEGLGYGLEDSAPHERTIATLPVGYADGYPRSLSNGRGHVIIRGQRAAVVGKVCMDMTMVDVTDISGAQVGDSVELFGRQLPIEDVAAAAGTIAYEILSRIPMRVLREQRGS
jgi:alanine racemase